MNQLMQSPFDDSDSDSDEETQMTMFNNMGGMMNFPGSSFQMSSIGGGGGGTFKSKQYSYQTYVDENGKQHVKKMEKSNNRHIDEYGNVMEDNEEMYKDSGMNFNKIKKGRRLNNRGMQITKENRNGEYSEFKQFHNMDEDDMGKFIHDWREKGSRIQPQNRRMIQKQKQKPLAIAYEEPKMSNEKRHKTRKYLIKEKKKNKKQKQNKTKFKKNKKQKKKKRYKKK